jgi:hypothetical protein
VSDGEDKKVSYVKEMIKHPTNVYSFFGAVTAAAILSIPFGLGIGALPLLAFMAGEGIASLFVPSSPKFRNNVDKRLRGETREKSRMYLVHEITRRVHSSDEGWLKYRRIREVIDSLATVAQHRKTSLTERDVERLDDASLNFLGLWLAKLVIEERRASIDIHQLAEKLANLDVTLEEAEAPEERRRLAKAREDLDRIYSRRKSLDSRATSVDAALLSMIDTFEEVYQQIATAPASPEVQRHLDDAVDRLTIEEGLDLAVEEELGEIYTLRRNNQAKAKAAEGMRT